jgi:hypothetical protein
MNTPFVRTTVVLVGSVWIASSGCGTGGPASTGAALAPAGPRPHSGAVFTLPGAKGFGELVVEYEKGSKKVKGSTRSQVVVYFLQPDRKSALTTPPSAVSARLDLPDGEPVTVALKPQADPKDPAGAARFASEPGRFDYDELRVELTATLDGQPFVQRLSVR